MPSHDAPGTHRPPGAGTAPRSIITTSQPTPIAAHRPSGAFSFITVKAAAAMVTTTSRRKTGAASVPASTHATAATAAPRMPPRRARSTVGAARLRRECLGDEGAVAASVVMGDRRYPLQKACPPADHCLQTKGKSGNVRALNIQEERSLAGRVAGLMYVVSAAIGGLLLVLPGVAATHWRVTLAAGFLGLVWGVLQFLALDRERVHPAFSHLSCSLGYPLLAVVAATTGGANS